MWKGRGGHELDGWEWAWVGVGGRVCDERGGRVHVEVRGWNTRRGEGGAWIKWKEGACGGWKGGHGEREGRGHEKREVMCHEDRGDRGHGEMGRRGTRKGKGRWHKERRGKGYRDRAVGEGNKGGIRRGEGGRARGEGRGESIASPDPLQPLSPKAFFVIKLFVTARRIARIAHIGFHVSPRLSVIPSHPRASSPLALLRAKKPTKRDCSVLTSRNALCERIHFVQR